ncbi:MAG: S1/P1 nuclease [Xanthomonadales bacterium]|nr:S1/P1 nuclease [Xanthomonadales bacterium]
MPVRILLLFVCMLTTGSAWGWGRDGHRIVGQLAQQRLSPQARAAVAELLAGEADPSLAGVAAWADHIRENEPAWAWSAPLHWVNFERGQCRYRARRNCRDGLCVVAGIQRYRNELADHTLPLERRREALKFVVHFVGDVHQPLHAGFVSDRGGNDFQISIERMGWNLHSVWDTLIIQSAGLEWPAYAERIDAQPLAPVAQAGAMAEDPAAWAEESCRIAQADDFYPPRHKITSRYLEAHRPQVDERLKLAGERLARILEKAL